MFESDYDAYISQMLLQVAQDLLTPRQFTLCLTESGLSEQAKRADFLQNPGPLPHEKVQHFFQAINTRCGESVYRLFTSNLGSVAGKAARNDPGIIQLRTQYGAEPSLQNLRLALFAVVAHMRGRGVLLTGPVPDSVTADTWQITFEPCQVCPGLTANAPICASHPSLLREMLAWVANTPVVTKEITCRACGQDACTVLVARAV